MVNGDDIQEFEIVLKSLVKKIDTFNKEIEKEAQVIVKRGNLVNTLKRYKQKLNQMLSNVEKNERFHEYIETNMPLFKHNMSDTDKQLLNNIILATSNDMTLELLRQMKIYEEVQKIYNERNMA